MTSAGPPVVAVPLGEALDEAPMTTLHRRFWLMSGLGIMLDGFDFFIIGVANPLIVADFGGSSTMQGLVSAAAIVGAIFGAAVLGTAFPILLDDIGEPTLLAALAVVSAIAFGVTAALRVEPLGKSLDEISGQTAAALGVRTVRRKPAGLSPFTGRRVRGPLSGSRPGERLRPDVELLRR